MAVQTQFFDSTSVSNFKCCYKKMRNDGNLLIVSNHDLEVFFLESTAKEAYLGFLEGKSLHGIIDYLITSKGYDVDYNELKNDLECFIIDLIEKDLLEKD